MLGANLTGRAAIMGVSLRARAAMLGLRQENSYPRWMG